NKCRTLPVPDQLCQAPSGQGHAHHFRRDRPSTGSDRALRWATILARESGSSLRLLHVVEGLFPRDREERSKRARSAALAPENDPIRLRTVDFDRRGKLEESHEGLRIVGIE